MGRCKGYTCLIYNDERCCYECKEKDNCFLVCEIVKQKDKCRFYDMQTKEEVKNFKKEKVCNFIRDVFGVAVWVFVAIGVVELFGDLGGAIIFAMIVIVVWLLPERKKGEEKHEDNFR